MIIGLTGPNCAGKTTVAELLRERGFTAWSLSDAVRDEASRRGVPHDRDTLIRVANDLRKNHGGGVLAQRMAVKIREALAINPKQHFAVDSIRSPLEVAELQKLPGFQLWLIDAPVELRFQRAVERGRAEGAQTLEEFQAKEAEEDTNDPQKQQLGNTFKMADQEVQNTGTMVQLERQIAHLSASAAATQHRQG